MRSCLRRNMDKTAENVVSKILALMIGSISIVAAQSAVAETLKVAVAQHGFWNSTFIEVGLKQGFFKEAGLDIEISTPRAAPRRSLR